MGASAKVRNRIEEVLLPTSTCQAGIELLQVEWNRCGAAFVFSDSTIKGITAMQASE